VWWVATVYPRATVLLLGGWMAAALPRVRHTTLTARPRLRVVVKPTRWAGVEVRSAVPVLKSANNSATVPLYRATVASG